ncbi:MAG TPA: hypothetical protein VE077_02770 [Candidatus Methylomirabilis sp.]|nr:hypothetical protein [Candidatus Methylomirabilis sp.]
MKNSQGPFDALKPIYRLGVVLIGLLFVSIGAVNVLGGRTNYFNAWEQVVFAPFAILVGLLLIVTVVVVPARKK